jgi:aminoglycoside phosphotransferase
VFFSHTVTQEVAAAALQALDAVHKCGLLHGDVEACNFMVGEGKNFSGHIMGSLTF